MDRADPQVSHGALNRTTLLSYIHDGVNDCYDSSYWGEISTPSHSPAAYELRLIVKIGFNSIPYMLVVAV